MANGNDDLDEFFSSISTKQEEKPSAPQTSTQATSDTNLEDEFTRLLSDFINNNDSTPSTPAPKPTPAPASSIAPQKQESLDDFLTPQTQAPSPQTTSEEQTDTSLEDEFARLLNNFISDSKETPIYSSSSFQETSSSGSQGIAQNSLDDFTNTLLNSSPQETQNLDSFITPQNQTTSSSISEPSSNSNSDDNPTKLKPEEFELSRAFFNFKDGILAIAHKKNLKTPSTDYQDKDLYPNYKPSIGKKIAQYLLNSWDVLNKYDPENMKRLSTNATDEEYLVFAESLTDTDMQLVIISYVEILINMEICEVKYEQMKEIVSKNKIKKELYEEYIALQERKALFIKKLKEKKFPIDVDRLINNYFKAAQKDSKGAYEALTKNPAMFAPIEFSQLKPKFFGLIKVAPEDGIKINQKIGAFIKKLKI